MSGMLSKARHPILCANRNSMLVVLPALFLFDGRDNFCRLNNQNLTKCFIVHTCVNRHLLTHTSKIKISNRNSRIDNTETS